ncbi:MAG: GNAT family N-acetyltransferase [Bacteroidota bacterium]|jgi:hypothetical protein
MEEALNIIPPIPKEALVSELTEDIFVRPTNNADNEIYIFQGDQKPNLMLEIGRLRELSFRKAGGGTGKSIDIDDFDTGEYSYWQLIVWNPEEQEIVGGYRFSFCSKSKDDKGNFHLSTREIFDYTAKLTTEYFPYTIELGRSFVQPNFQPTADSRKGIFSLDNLWDGLGALVVNHPEIKYFFGKVTMYSDFQRDARNLILGFMNAFFPDRENLVNIQAPVKIGEEYSAFIDEISHLEFKEAHRLLTQKVRELGTHIPPLFNAYMSLSPTMKTFGTAINHHFGEVEETGIMVTINDIYDQKKDRHISSYLKYLESKKI